ncbi:hypothetical protein QJQ45_010155 [Haematococcus lacustris]|nr:hypothetical protein QJQ45_010155 [Haematococcus lacustris]
MRLTLSLLYARNARNPVISKEASLARSSTSVARSQHHGTLSRNVITRFREDSVFEPTLAPSLPSTTVPVLFQLNSPSLGSWDLTKAVPLKWMPGDFWCGLAFLPDSELVEFKFVLLDAHNGYRAKGWANDVSGPGNLTMDVRRSGCLLAKGQVRAHAATPELSTELEPAVQEFLSTSLAAAAPPGPTPAVGLLPTPVSTEPLAAAGATAAEPAVTRAGEDPIEVAVLQVSGSMGVGFQAQPTAIKAPAHNVPEADEDALPLPTPLAGSETVSEPQSFVSSMVSSLLGYPPSRGQAAAAVPDLGVGAPSGSSYEDEPSSLHASHLHNGVSAAAVVLPATNPSSFTHLHLTHSEVHTFPPTHQPLAAADEPLAGMSSVDVPPHSQPLASGNDGSPSPLGSEAGSLQPAPSMYDALADQVAQRHALDGERGQLLPSSAPDGAVSGPGTDVVPEAGAAAGGGEGESGVEAPRAVRSGSVLPEFGGDSVGSRISAGLSHMSSALQGMVSAAAGSVAGSGSTWAGPKASYGVQEEVPQEEVQEQLVNADIAENAGLQLPVSFESATAASMVADMVGADEELPVAPLDSGTTPITGASAAAGSSMLLPRHNPVVMAASLVVTDVMVGAAQAQQWGGQAGVRTMALRSRPARPLSARGRTTSYNVGSATAARLYLEMFGGSSSGSGR